ncbi:YjzD family protein [Sporosarcina thermotolerans]|uniref:YjzD family protein n=1 Tax=Sporosarcina thermotolerans TaxID=633404 RepID=A0AAW9A7P7_9BACL|nr:YjzD family protein [Sporosarcina thermotolerans]MDW0117005.1 YjzD family protein [Sporosarcina thermotolerans]WHT47891.1 YjzD family protein [Sporosarcina thermotolerans]
MKYIMTFFWSFLLVSMLNYVAGSIAGIASFDFMTGIIASVVLSVIILLMTTAIPEGEVADH